MALNQGLVVINNNSKAIFWGIANLTKLVFAQSFFIKTAISIKNIQNRDNRNLAFIKQTPNFAA